MIFLLKKVRKRQTLDQKNLQSAPFRKCKCNLELLHRGHSSKTKVSVQGRPRYPEWGLRYKLSYVILIGIVKFPDTVASRYGRVVNVLKIVEEERRRAATGHSSILEGWSFSIYPWHHLQQLRNPFSTLFIELTFSPNLIYCGVLQRAPDEMKKMNESLRRINIQQQM